MCCTLLFARKLHTDCSVVSLSLFPCLTFFLCFLSGLIVPRVYASDENNDFAPRLISIGLLVCNLEVDYKEDTTISVFNMSIDVSRPFLIIVFGGSQVTKSLILVTGQKYENFEHDNILFMVTQRRQIWGLMHFAPPPNVCIYANLGGGGRTALIGAVRPLPVVQYT
jgi:hypothetical protein